MTHLFDLGEPFFVAGEFGHEGLVLHPFPVQLLSFIPSSITSCQHPIGLRELCSATPHTHMHRAIQQTATTLARSVTISYQPSHTHACTRAVKNGTRPLRPDHSGILNATLRRRQKKAFTSTTNTHTHTPINLQSKEESSTSAECAAAAAVGSGAQGRGFRWVLMSSRLACRPLQFCCSIRASVQRFEKTTGTHA